MSKLSLSFVIISFLCASTLLAQGQSNHIGKPKISTFSCGVSPASSSSVGNANAPSNSLKKTVSMPFPVMVYPANGATNIPLIPKFSIKTVIGGLRYDLQVASDQYFNNIIETPYLVFSSPNDSVFQFRFDPSIIDPTSFTNNTTYYWRVKVTDSSGQNTSGWSQPYSYTTTSAGVPVSQPTLSLPADYDTVPWVGMTFHWYPSSGATQYQIQWSTSYSFNGFTYSWSDANQTSLTENLKPNTTYYWRVVAYNDGTISQFSPTGTFYTGTIDTLTAASGWFDDGSGTDNYANGLDIEWLIEPPNAKQIVLSFSSFKTVAGSDYVTIYDGTTTDAPILAQLSGDTIPNPISSSSGSMLVHFTTGYYWTDPGWTASYYTVNRTDAITGKVLNVAFDPWTGDSSATPLAQATVSFYNGNSFIGKAPIGSDGTFELNDLIRLRSIR
ncbi:MAG: CUB domain-containing protein [Candidatus Kryptoniota bacterium]